MFFAKKLLFSVIGNGVFIDLNFFFDYWFCHWFAVINFISNIKQKIYAIENSIVENMENATKNDWCTAKAKIKYF